MATAEVDVPPSNSLLPGSYLLSTSHWPEPSSAGTEQEEDPKEVVSKWVASFNEFIASRQHSSKYLFSDDCYWRDLLCVSWDFRTIQGPSHIDTFVQNTIHTCTLEVDASKEYKKPQVISLGGLEIIQTFLKVDTKVGRGEGLVRLAKSKDGGVWKAFTLFTTLKELKGHEENIDARRPSGNDRDPVAGGMNWKDRRDAQMNFEGDRQPVVLIIGKESYTRSLNVRN